MDAVAKRIKGVHPNAMKNMSKNPRYLSGGLQEYYIKHDGSLWRISRHCGGILPEKLRGGWMSVVECERVLISHLRHNDKFGRAIYPGAKSNKE